MAGVATLKRQSPMQIVEGGTCLYSPSHLRSSRAPRALALDPRCRARVSGDLEGRASRNLGRTLCTRCRSRMEMEPVYWVEICKMASINLGDTVFALPSMGRKVERATTLPTVREPSGLTWNFCVQQMETR